jgi:hypothetical protein
MVMPNAPSPIDPFRCVVSLQLVGLEQRIQRVHSQLQEDGTFTRNIHEAVHVQGQELARLTAMFEKLKRRVERSDPMHLSTQVSVFTECIVS